MGPKIKLQLIQIADQIIKKYHPLKIILYGSRAKGKPKEDSDFDILVIKKTSQDPIKRIQQLSSLVDRQIPCDFLVYTPEEIDYRLSIGDFFIKEIVERGKIIYEAS